MSSDVPRRPGVNAAAGVPAATKWERAYQAFETPEQELVKFVARLREIGADRWDRRSRVLEVWVPEIEQRQRVQPEAGHHLGELVRRSAEDIGTPASRT